MGHEAAREEHSSDKTWPDRIRSAKCVWSDPVLLVYLQL